LSADLDLGTSFTNVPGGTATWTFTDSTGNYNDDTGTAAIVITKADAVVVVTPYTNASTTYNGLPHTATVTSISGVNGETGATVGSVDVSNTTHTNAGTYASDTWTFTGTANYANIAATTITDSISPASLSITADANIGTPAVDAFGKVYDGAVFSPFTARYSGFVNGETPLVLTGTLAFSGAGTSAVSAGGPYAVTPGGLTSTNYAITFVAGSLTIAKANTTTTITSDAPDSSVVAQTYTVTWTVTLVSPGGGTLTGNVTVTGDGTCTAAVGAGQCDLTSTSAGAKTLTATYGGGANFNSSSDTETHQVNTRATTTTVVCDPMAQKVGLNVLCTATVTDIETNGPKSPPQGIVTFSKAAADLGSFVGSATCQLSPTVTTGTTNNCSVQYTSLTPTVDAISASYAGNTTHLSSANPATLAVLVAFYDPSGGFVTGGGWINSPTGAYRPNPNLTGRANFGFVSKYLKGATIPTGQTEFQFQVGNLNFHSEVYQWLVVSSNGTKAQYKGTGTINGAGNFGFLLTAWDGSPDRFRIKIWDKNNGDAVVYDNNFTSPDDIDTQPMAIAGGSIVIHK
ncbi:MAG: Ig-like domain repeat protein, partial [Chloroflexi bacterium]|nr:Ig-like domain repeat protein [Chloroflexota bacterium]